jgi:hypothetical protein
MTRQLIDDIMPQFDVAASYGIDVAAPPSIAYAAISQADFSRSTTIRVLMSLRRGKPLKDSRSGSWRERLQESSFIELAESPDRELVLGIVGKFWRPDGGACSKMTPQEFHEFSRPEFARAAWNFAVTEKSQNSSRMTTETRIQCLGRTARWRFRSYWLIVGPFSGLIRKVMLRQIKIEAERRFSVQSGPFGV